MNSGWFTSSFGIRSFEKSVCEEVKIKKKNEKAIYCV